MSKQEQVIILDYFRTEFVKIAKTRSTSRAVAVLDPGESNLKIWQHYGSSATYKSILLIRTNSAMRTIHSAGCLTLAWR